MTSGWRESWQLAKRARYQTSEMPISSGFRIFRELNSKSDDIATDWRLLTVNVKLLRTGVKNTRIISELRIISAQFGLGSRDKVRYLMRNLMMKELVVLLQPSFVLPWTFTFPRAPSRSISSSVR